MAVIPTNDVATFTDEAGATRAAQGVAIVSAPAQGLSSRSVPSNAASGGGVIATNGGTATVAFANTDLTEVINPSTASLWARWQASGGAAAVNGAGSFEIKPGGTFVRDRVAGTLNLLSTAASQPYTVNRYAPA